ncbi:MAG: hypothetical protein R2818_04780 [Flavobacteriales bacterium]
MFLLKKNESRISHTSPERLLKAKSTFKQENQQIIQDIVRDLQSSRDEHNWAEFEAHFTRVHSTFYQSLQETIPIAHTQRTEVVRLSPTEHVHQGHLREYATVVEQHYRGLPTTAQKAASRGSDVHSIDFLPSI